MGGKRGRNRRVLLAVASLLSPFALMALVLGVWRIAADLRWTNDFAIREGFFSHAQVWIVTAAFLQACSSLLNRYARPRDPDAAGESSTAAARSAAARRT